MLITLLAPRSVGRPNVRYKGLKLEGAGTSSHVAASFGVSRTRTYRLGLQLLLPRNRGPRAMMMHGHEIN